MESLELGIFMPIANNGWIISKNAPQYMPSWELNKKIGEYAEAIGFDSLFSMIKWRGFGGETKHWDYSMESVTLMAALAAITSRIGIIASVQPLVFNPAVAAKMVATIDGISGGRFGINFVTGQYFDEYAQMGVLPENYAKTRYDYAEEWVQLVKRLWSEERVTAHGKYFSLTDCVSNPKPIQKPFPPIVCAGMSERGMAFTAQYGTRCFVSGTDFDNLKTVSKRAKEVGRSFGKSVQTDTVLVMIIEDTDEQAQAVLQQYRDGVDVEAWRNIFRIYSKDEAGASSQMVVERAKKDVFFGFLPVVGSARTVAKILSEIAVSGEFDGLMFTFPDYLKGLQKFNEEVKPHMIELGISFKSNLEIVQ
jgi:pyrimidine oxygenase